MKRNSPSLLPLLPAGIAAALTAADVILSLFPRTVLSPMTHLLLLIPAALCIFAAGRLHAAHTDKDRRQSIMEFAWRIITALLLWLLLCLTLFDQYFGRTGFSALFSLSGMEYMRALSRSVNWIPFSTIAEYVGYLTHPDTVGTAVVNLFGNLAAFASLGLLYPLSFPRLRRFLPCTAAAACTVSAVEIAQLLLLAGACDIDDLILNVLGVWAVFFFFRIPPIRRLTQRIAGVSLQ